jgi:hypothetical protein
LVNGILKYISLRGVVNKIINVFDGEVTKISYNSFYIVWMTDSNADNDAYPGN